jgi:hypothetical protein
MATGGRDGNHFTWQAPVLLADGIDTACKGLCVAPTSDVAGAGLQLVNCSSGAARGWTN